MGVVCTGKDIVAAGIAADITRQAIVTKAKIQVSGGEYRGLSDDHLFDMEYRAFQQNKVKRLQTKPLEGSVALVTGSAGAIGTGIVQKLLDEGCHVALTDLPGEVFDKSVASFRNVFGPFVTGVPLDVTDPDSVAAGFNAVAALWGGVDLIIVNAGIAHVQPLAEMDLERFRKLERVNVDGTLLTLREAARLFKAQATGGDIVVISTKNVFAPGAKFGAYSATKAASHQLARIASLELADLAVRVNMVAPDAVFSHGDKRSGLWAEVGPDRMRARGLDEKGLENYYQSRNLLKARVTAEHVANAVMFFATHQTPTTGATIPVDGGLPDATPR
jgi:NAD(P)-dependent dehydrogenase (short-subunit alcohol dehydrogenase family)